MDKDNSMDIHKEFDIITARMRARGLARTAGFNLVDQARISLATSSAARTLGVDGTLHNQVTITMECINGMGRTGIRVTCCKASAVVEELAVSAFDDTRRMMDELSIETLRPTGIQVTLIKWLEGETLRVPIPPGDPATPGWQRPPGPAAPPG